MEFLEKIRNLLDKVFLVLGGVSVLALMALATGNVCCRIFGMPYRGAYELVAFLRSRGHSVCPGVHPEEEKPHRCGHPDRDLQ